MVFLKVSEDPKMVAVLADLIEQTFSEHVEVTVLDGEAGIMLREPVVEKIISFLSPS